MINKETEIYKIVLEYLKSNSPCTTSEILLEALKWKILDSPKKDIRNCLNDLRKQGLARTEFDKETKTRYFSVIEKN
ncbi:MAG: hypothetical protein KAU07_02660 [Candidatus Andersenbacteria bacterium]|nr:hypothetical protein [Candidatus Andersenbacteria bacterium]